MSCKILFQSSALLCIRRRKFFQRLNNSAFRCCKEGLCSCNIKKGYNEQLLSRIEGTYAGFTRWNCWEYLDHSVIPKAKKVTLTTGKASSFPAVYKESLYLHCWNVDYHASVNGVVRWPICSLLIMSPETRRAQQSSYWWASIYPCVWCLQSYE